MKANTFISYSDESVCQGPKQNARILTPTVGLLGNAGAGGIALAFCVAYYGSSRLF